ALKRLPEIHSTRYAAGSVYHLYVVRLTERDAVLRFLNAQGIGAGIHYPFALHELEAYAFLRYRKGEFPVAEDWARRCLSLPLYPELTPNAADRCVDAFEKALATLGSQ